MGIGVRTTPALVHRIIVVPLQLVSVEQEVDNSIHATDTLHYNIVLQAWTASAMVWYVYGSRYCALAISPGYGESTMSKEFTLQQHPRCAMVLA